MTLVTGKPYYIYCHTAPNGKRYIGQTCLDPRTRWKNGRGYVSCTYIYRAIKKYGWDNFRHDILCVVHSRKMADLFEKYYIKKYDTLNEEHGYNLTEGGAGVVGCVWDEERKRQRSEKISGEGNPMYGRHHTAECRARISQNRRGKEVSPEMREFRTGVLLESNKKRRVPINQYDLDGNLIATYEGFGDMERATGFDHSPVVDVCQGKYDTAYGFKWEYVDESRKADADEYRARRPKSGMGVIQMDCDGTEIARFSSLSEAERETGVNRDRIGDCCHGSLEDYGGYKWKFSDAEQQSCEKTAVIQFDLDGNELNRFSSLAEASASVGLTRYQIRNCCRGAHKQSGGFIWKYEDESLTKRKSGIPIGVIQLDMSGNEVASFASLTEAERMGFNRHAISECCKGTRETYQGFLWRYSNAA